jgi:hypothetical protein
MHSHGNFMHKGHWMHPYRGPTLTYEEPPALYPNKIIGGNDDERANKRSHESGVTTGHKMPPSKVPRKEPSVISDQSSVAESSDDMNQSSSSSSLSGHYHACIPCARCGNFCEHCTKCKGLSEAFRSPLSRRGDKSILANPARISGIRHHTS